MNDTCGRPEDVQERVREQLNQMNQLQPGLSGAGREMGVFEKRLHDELQRTREILDRTRRELAEKESYTRAVVAELEEMKEKQRLVELVRQQRSAIADSRIAVSHLRKIAGARIIEGMIDIVLDNGDRIKIHGQTMTGFGIDGCGGAG